MCIRDRYRGDRSRKQTLVDYGFRLPVALDNRPLRFDEWEKLSGQRIFLSATPSKYELENSGNVVELVARPTGLTDPQVEVRPATHQVDDLQAEIIKCVDNGDRVLVTVLTKRMAEDLTEYLDENGTRVRYLHSDIETVERVEIIRDLRLGAFDVLVGINLLREGLDIPEVALVAVLDADKEGFDYWVNQVRSGTQSLDQVAANIKASPESEDYRAKTPERPTPISSGVGDEDYRAVSIRYADGHEPSDEQHRINQKKFWEEIQGPTRRFGEKRNEERQKLAERTPTVPDERKEEAKERSRQWQQERGPISREERAPKPVPVSYTHLTLPTKA